MCPGGAAFSPTNHIDRWELDLALAARLCKSPSLDGLGSARSRTALFLLRVGLAAARSRPKGLRNVPPYQRSGGPHSGVGELRLPSDHLRREREKERERERGEREERERERE